MFRNKKLRALVSQHRPIAFPEGSLSDLERCGKGFRQPKDIILIRGPRHSHIYDRLHIFPSDVTAARLQNDQIGPQLSKASSINDRPTLHGSILKPCREDMLCV